MSVAHKRMRAQDFFETLPAGAPLDDDPNWTAYQADGEYLESSGLTQVYFTSGGRAVYAYTGLPPTDADHSSWIEFDGFEQVGTLTAYVGVACRIRPNGGSYDCYIGLWRGNLSGGSLRIYRITAASAWLLAEANSGLVQGDTLRLEAVTNVDGDVALRLFKNDGPSEVVSVTDDDAANKITDAGLAGVYGLTGSGGTPLHPRIKEWRLYEPALRSPRLVGPLAAHRQPPLLLAR